MISGIAGLIIVLSVFGAFGGFLYWIAQREGGLGYLIGMFMIMAVIGFVVLLTAPTG